MLLEQLEAICQYDSVVVTITSRAHPTLVSKVYSMLLNQENRKNTKSCIINLEGSVNIANLKGGYRRNFQN